jgi:hypothetical protein
MTPPRPALWQPERALERLTAALEAEILAAPEADGPSRVSPEARDAVASALVRAAQGGALALPPPGSRPAPRRG